MNRPYDRYPLHSRFYAVNVGILASLQQRTRARHTQNPCILRMVVRGRGGESASETDRCDGRAASGARGERRRRGASSPRVISRLAAVADGRRNESSPAARLRAASLNAGRGEGVTRGTPCLSARLDAAADDTGRRAFRRTAVWEEKFGAPRSVGARGRRGRIFACDPDRSRDTSGTSEVRNIGESCSCVKRFRSRESRVYILSTDFCALYECYGPRPRVCTQWTTTCREDFTARIIGRRPSRLRIGE